LPHGAKYYISLKISVFRVGVDIFKFFGVRAGVGFFKQETGMESKKCDSTHLWLWLQKGAFHIRKSWKYSSL